MTIHDPLLAQQYGGQEAYEQLAAEGAFPTRKQFSELSGIDKITYLTNIALVGLLSVISYEVADSPNFVNNPGIGTLVLGGFAYLSVGPLEENISMRY